MSGLRPVALAAVVVLSLLAAGCEADATDRAEPSEAAPGIASGGNPCGGDAGAVLERIRAGRRRAGQDLGGPDDRRSHAAAVPFMSPTPPPDPSALDGTYLRTLTLRDVGGARIGLPYRCLRCPPFRIDAGVSTLIFTRGAYYLHHQLSGFRTMGSFVVEDDRVTLFNDANCPQTPGIYAFEVTAHGLRFRVVEDDCPFSGERSFDLMVRPWTRVSACVRRIANLWPGEVAC